VEDEIIKELENITNLYIFPVTVRVVVIKLGLIMKKEQFAKFREWLISKGFIEVEADASGTHLPLLKHLLILLGYTVFTDKSRRRLGYFHNDGTKAVFIIYTLDEVVTIEGITYFEQSQ
jgi:hypothetical protein